MTLITIYARSSVLIFLLSSINLVYLVNCLTITSIALHFYFIPSLINSSNLIIQFIITLLYSCLGALYSYSKLQSLYLLILFYQHLLHFLIVSCASFLKCAIKQYYKTLFIIILTPNCLYSSNLYKFYSNSVFYFLGT